MRRGDVWWMTEPPPVKRRPVLILLRDEAVQLRDQVVVAFVTSNRRGLPTEVELDERDGMTKPCVVNLDTIQTVPKRRLLEAQTTLTERKMQQVKAALLFALDMED
jgi:mRNA interferase MazF